MQWPGNDHEQNRIATAKTDIKPNEAMMVISKKVMITKLSCLQSEELRDVYDNHIELFRRDDHIMALYIVYEKLKGKDSFYHPYFEILPEPDVLENWSDDELAELQHP